jgi:AraC-like DNA-binding protein
MFAGDGWYSSENGFIHKMEIGDGVMISPGFVHKYSGEKENYIEDAISFCGPVADNMYNAGIIKDGVLKIGHARRLLPIIDLVLDASTDSQIKANIALENLLIELYFENKEKCISSANLFWEKLLEEIKRQPDKWWDVSSMAEFCNLSLSQFNRAFRLKTEMTPKTFVDNLKMQLAIEMLAEKTNTVKSISIKLGYLDPYHFSRRFKKLKGFSPQKYREIFLK